MPSKLIAMTPQLWNRIDTSCAEMGRDEMKRVTVTEWVRRACLEELKFTEYASRPKGMHRRKFVAMHVEIEHALNKSFLPSFKRMAQMSRTGGR